MLEEKETGFEKQLHRWFEAGVSVQCVIDDVKSFWTALEGSAEDRVEAAKSRMQNAIEERLR